MTLQNKSLKYNIKHGRTAEREQHKITDLLLLIILSFSIMLPSCSVTHLLEQVSGTPLTSDPFFRHNDVFMEGEDLYIAIDPNRFSGRQGETYAIYVVPHQGEWMDGTPLQDISGNIETVTLNPGMLSNNHHLVWEKMMLSNLPHKWHDQFDIVLDFDADGTYDLGKDIVDSVGVFEILGAEPSGGFTLIKDPAVPGDFQHGYVFFDAGEFTVNVPPEYKEPIYDTDPLTVSMRAAIWYPATLGEATDPTNAQVSDDWSKYPLVLIAHGAHGQSPSSYRGYWYLMRQLASRGYIVVSVDLHDLETQYNGGWRIHHRGVTILEYLDRLLNQPLPTVSPEDVTTRIRLMDLRNKIDIERIGLIGHSRGGEAVVAAQNIHAGQNLTSYKIKALATLSPTDGVELAPYAGPYRPEVPFLMIYGTRDRDVMEGSGYRLVDRAARPKFAVTLHGANHEYFNENWVAGDESAITREQQELQTKALITSFLNAYVLDQQAYAWLLSGQTEPNSIQSIGNVVQYTYQPAGTDILLPLDIFQTAPADPFKNTLGQSNDYSGFSEFTEERLSLKRWADTGGWHNTYFYYTDGLRLKWQDVSSRFDLHLDSTQLDILK